MVEKSASRKRGNKLGFWFFKTILSTVGLRGAYGFLFFVSLHYLIFDRKAYNSCVAYLKKRFKGQGTLMRILGVYKIFINQGKNLIDRYYYLSGLGKFEAEIKGFKTLNAMLENSSKGFVLLTAHVGNWQVTMNSLSSFKREVHLLMRPEENVAVKEALVMDKGGGKIKIISTESFLSGILESVKVLDRGGIVSIMGDRPYGDNNVEVNLLGDRATLPHGAFSIAASVGCPVVVLLSPKVHGKKDVVDVTNIILPKYSSQKNKSNDMKGWLQEFADILSDFAKKYPYQWFVFYDLWIEEDSNQRQM